MHEIAGSARGHLHLWGIPPGCECTLLNVSENVTCLVETGSGYKTVLRIHRPGYQDENAIRSELAWIRALLDDRIIGTPAIIPGCNGRDIQTGEFPGPSGNRQMVMFEHIPGYHPDTSTDLSHLFRMLGSCAARLHNHISSWTRPDWFVRPSWNIDSVFGPRPTWGNWRDAPNITPKIRNILERAEKSAVRGLATYGTSDDRYSLIHADMRIANIISAGTDYYLIDFDDCGFGWLLFDFAAAVSFIEHMPVLANLWNCWCQGYSELRTLPPCHEEQADNLVIMRRLALLAWIGSRPSSTEPMQMANDFALNTALVAERYLEGSLLR